MHRILSASLVGGARRVSRRQQTLQKTAQRLINVPTHELCWAAQRRQNSTLSTDRECESSSQIQTSSKNYNRWTAHRENKQMPRREDLPQDSIQEGHKLFSLLGAYRSHFVPLMEHENLEEANRTLERLSTWGVDELIEEGYMLTDLTVYEYRKKNERLHDGHTFGFRPPTGELFESNLFARGVHVTVVPSTDSPLDYKDNYPLNFKDPMGPTINIPKAVVLYSTEEEVRVRFLEGRLKFPQDMKWRLDLSASDIAFTRAKDAINSLNYDPAKAEVASSAERQYALRGTYLRDELLGGWPSNSEAQSQGIANDGFNTDGDASSLLCSDEAIRDWSHRYSTSTPDVKDGDPELPLNPSQIQAIAMMMKGSLTLVQGPPGTGKTKTIIETIRLLKKHFQIFHPVLICTYTNVAVDNLVGGLVQAGLNPLRVGSEGGVREDLEKWSLQAKMETHSSWTTLTKLKDKLIDQRIRLAKLSPRGEKSLEVGQIKEHITATRSQIRKLRCQMQYEIYCAADVVCTTCLTAGAPSFGVLDFPIVFLDEASMSTEPASLIPLMHGCRQLALIGDHKQLPPVITSAIAQKGGLSRSLFERLMDEKKYPTIMLNTQYRMHPTISAFPSKNFYNTALKDGTVLPSGAAILSPPRSRHLSRRKSLQTGEIPSVLFIHHDNYEITKDRSKANLKEISIVMAILEDLLLSNPEMNGKDIGIISPYVAQTRLLDFTLKDDPAWAKYFEGRFGRSRAVEMKNVEVKTVDGFEGREKDVIIFSTVRNNHYGHIGFLADRRRMNVALTRAKRALFVVGSLSTLSKGRYGDDVWNSSGESMEREVGKMMIFGGGDEWQKYVQFVIAHQLFVELDHPLEYRSAEEVAEFERMHQTSTI